ncbi:hypothetical protein A5759_23290 [Mycobacterium sp. 852014-52144_SCH5372336]|nr:hypothetical protein A5759_23290 [Mycobacterium sp. 852014-52144_SCH5372336]
MTRGSQVKAKRLVWWELGLVLQYAINLLAAREGKGKSTVASSWAARETRDGGTVLWIGTEESREHAIVPRLIASDADMDRVIFIDVETDLGTGALVFPLDLHAIENVIREHSVTMMFLDPAKAVVPPGFSGNDDIAVRQYLEPIATLAHRCKVTIIGLAHFGKRDGADSGQLLLGSVAWSQVARCVLSIAEDPDTGTRVLTNTKANYSGTDRSVEFRIVSTMIDTDDGPTEIGSVEWLGDTTLDARDILSGLHDDDTHDIDRWLSDFLANGSVKATEVFSSADAAGYSKDQAKRAKKRLGIIADRPHNPGPWFWSLPIALSTERTEQGAPSRALPALPALPVRSEGVQQGAKPPREQSAHDCSLPPSPAAMPAKLPASKPEPPREHRRTIRGQPASSYPACIHCGKPVVAGQGEAHFECSKRQAAS